MEKLWYLDPVWIGVYISALALIVPLIWKFFTRKRKQLTYIPIFDTSIIQINKNFANKKKLRIEYGNTPAKTLQQIRVKFTNTGNQPIEPEDFVTPVSFIAGKKSKDNIVTGYHVITFPKTRHDGIKPMMFHKDFRHGFEPLLLNKGDYFYVDILNVDITDDKTALDVQGHIKGVDQIKRGVPYKPLNIGFSDYMILVFGIFFLFIGVITSLNYIAKFYNLEVESPNISIMAGVVLISGIFLYLRDRYIKSQDDFILTS